MRLLIIGFKDKNERERNLARDSTAFIILYKN